jgi:hypothetical protein
MGFSPRPALVALILSAAVACSDTTGPNGDNGNETPTINLAIAVGGSTAAPARAPSFDIVMSDGTNTVELTRVAIVLREIELKLQEDDDCEDSSSGDNDDCEEFEVGPILLELPLDGELQQLVTLENVTPGVYDELEFDIHKPSDDSAEDLAFLLANPEFEDVSIWVDGRFNGIDFTYLTDLNEEQEIDLVPPLVIDGATSTTVTLLLHLENWFKEGNGTLIDPASANDGGPNENLVRDNIRDSIEGFEDEDRDGRDD